MKNLILLGFSLLMIVGCKKRDVIMTPLTDLGLVAHYPFDGDANDHTSNRNHGLTSATLTSDRKGVPNKAFEFVRNEFQSSNIPINLKNNYTFSFWVKMNAYDDGMVVMELAKDRACNKNPQIWQTKDTIFLTTSSDISNRIPIMSMQRIKVGIDSPTWRHVLWTVKNDTTSVYVGGVLLHKRVVAWPNITNVDLTLGTAGNHCTGDHGASNYHNQPSKVSIDEVRIYNRVLNLSEIQQLSR